MILSNAREKINRYNQCCLHYNLVADSVYKVRRSVSDLFGTDYVPYLVAVLISFEMGKLIGKAELRYSMHPGRFAWKLLNKLKSIKSRIAHFINIRLTDVNLSRETPNIMSAYDELASRGKNSLHSVGKEFHVGATKILHFINPELFLIIDSNVSRAFRASHGINYRNSTQPGYSAEKYVDCLEYAKADLIAFGEYEFCSLEKDSPMARIYDKLSFTTGCGWL